MTMIDLRQYYAVTETFAYLLKLDVHIMDEIGYLPMAPKPTNLFMAHKT